MILTKFSICSTLAGIGYFAAAKSNMANPVYAAAIGSQVIGRAIEYAQAGDMAQLHGYTYYLGTFIPVILGETLKYSGTFSPEMSYLVAGVSLAIAHSYISDKNVLGNILRPRLTHASAAA